MRLKEKDLRVNIGKMKVMNCKVGVGQVENSVKYPCGICRKGVAENFTCCSSRKKWIHKRCNGVVDSPGRIGNLMCKNCTAGGVKVVHEVKQFVLVNNDKMKVVGKFCYLGNVIGKGGGAEESSIARVRCAWVKFKDLKMLLTAREASLRVKGK